MHSFDDFLETRDIIEYVDEFDVSFDRVQSFISSIPREYPEIFGSAAPNRAPHQWDALLCTLMSVEFPD